MNEGMDKQPKDQPFRACLINRIHLMRSERRMMSPHHSLVPHLLCWFMILWIQSADPIMTAVTFQTHTNIHYHLGEECMCTMWKRITGRERWGKFSNASSKCQLKITGVLEKVRSDGNDISPPFFDIAMFFVTGLLPDMMGSTLSVP